MTFSWRFGVFGSLATIALTISGCGAGDGGPAKYKVWGTVTFDGQPVDDGLIVFTPTESGAGPEAAPIKNGKYSIQSKGGMQKVTIEASREVPGKTQDDFKGGTVPVKEGYIPEKYNKNSELTADVKKGGGSFDFKLTN